MDSYDLLVYVAAGRRFLTATKGIQQPQQGYAPLDNLDGTRKRTYMESY